MEKFRKLQFFLRELAETLGVPVPDRKLKILGHFLQNMQKSVFDTSLCLIKHIFFFFLMCQKRRMLNP